MANGCMYICSIVYCKYKYLNVIFQKVKLLSSFSTCHSLISFNATFTYCEAFNDFILIHDNKKFPDFL